MAYKTRLGFLALVGIIFILGGWFISRRPIPVAMDREIYDGVTYRRVVQYFPHSMVAHVLIVDTNTQGMSFLVTPPDETADGAMPARTTSEFLEEFDLQVAVNGDEFFPWWSRTPLDYYPHSGDAVTPSGFSAQDGEIYADGLQDIRPEPTLYISRRNDLSFNRRPDKVFQAISGDRMLVLAGELVEGLEDEELHPRTALGINRNGRWLYLVVVDGRQPFYSSGATLQELAELLNTLGAHFAMAMDGGGSSTMVMAGEFGEAVVLNSPVDGYIPGRERAVANHFGIFISP